MEVILFILNHFILFKFYDIFLIVLYLFIKIGISFERIEVNESAKVTEKVNVVNVNENEE